MHASNQMKGQPTCTTAGTLQHREQVSGPFDGGNLQPGLQMKLNEPLQTTGREIVFYCSLM